MDSESLNLYDVEDNPRGALKLRVAALLDIGPGP